MICELCKRDSGTERFCVSCLQAVAKMFKPKQDIPVLKKVQPRAIYWKVTNGDYSCMIDWRDAQNEEQARREAASPLTRWYFHGDPEGIAVSVQSITHNEYCDWLKSGHNLATEYPLVKKMFDNILSKVTRYEKEAKVKVL